LDGKSVASLVKVAYPAGKTVRLGFSAQPLSVYEGAVTIRAQIAVAWNAGRRKTEIALRARVQPCSEDACLAPQTLSTSLALEVL
ncbi:MAG: protein-disulfide reductase DsbD domain-containing protein, partial [Candidatus Brocadiia bacterium]